MRYAVGAFFAGARPVPACACPAAAVFGYAPAVNAAFAVVGSPAPFAAANARFIHSAACSAFIQDTNIKPRAVGGGGGGGGGGGAGGGGGGG
ncbi:MAG: hypothetical protein LBG74_07615, partial [Spirochaetaceae bacterium]|nr:hypothetical protein [Spirochaetaceae bacterium]